MALGIKSSQDFWTGCVFIGFGAGTVVLSLSHPLGTAARMGPGFFPTALGGFLSVIGLVILLKSLAGAPGQKITRITVSGGIARSPLMCEILATVLNRELELLQSDEGPALGAAVTAMAALETHLRREHGEQTPFTVADAVATMVRFKQPAKPNTAWREFYASRRTGFRSCPF